MPTPNLTFLVHCGALKNKYKLGSTLYKYMNSHSESKNT